MANIGHACTGQSVVTEFLTTEDIDSDIDSKTSLKREW